MSCDLRKDLTTCPRCNVEYFDNWCSTTQCPSCWVSAAKRNSGASMVYDYEMPNRGHPAEEATNQQVLAWNNKKLSFARPDGSNPKEVASGT